MTSKVAVPKFSSKISYERYKIELDAWSSATDITKEKQGIVVALSLPEDDESHIRDKVFSDIDLAKLKGENGLEELIKYLDDQFGKDDLTETYERYVAFDTCKRESDQKINDFILQYEQRYNALARKDAKLPEVILAMKLIDSSNLSDVDKKLVLSGMDYTKKTELFNQSKTSLRKFIGEQASTSNNNSSPAIKLETFVSEHHEALIAAGWQQPSASSSRSNSNRRFNKPMNNFNNNRNSGNQGASASNYRTNPLGRDGQPLRCFNCNSIMHMKSRCPQGRGYYSQGRDKEDDIVLFTGYDLSEMVLLAHESWYSAILDSGCSSTVCGEKWFNDFLSRMDENARKLVERKTSCKVFHFGGGEKLPSKGAVIFPCVLAGRAVKICTNIVESDIPLLLSIESMKRAEMIWDFQKGVVQVFGKQVVLDVTSCGHHTISISPTEISVEDCLVVTKLTDDNEWKKKILKLHLQFAHPPKDKFIKLLSDAKSWKESFTNFVDSMYKDCKTCDVFQKTPSRPVVAMPEAYEFNDLVVMDLKIWRSMYLLHIIDAFSRFSVSVVIKDKTPQIIAHQFLIKWVGAGYGLCKKMKFDNGGEFNNSHIRELSDCLGIEIKATAAKSPWQNGLCERNHAVTDRCLEKILDDNPAIPLEVALAYACNAKNSLQMWNGYSSYQLVFGGNPKVPDIFHATIPQLEGKTQSEILAIHLNTLQSARRGYIETQCDEKIRQALHHQIRCNLEHYTTGDKVYYKRDDSNRWHGPGTVIGQDRQVVFVRHGRVYVRIPTCRLKKIVADGGSSENFDRIEKAVPNNDENDDDLDNNQEDGSREENNDGGVSSNKIVELSENCDSFSDQHASKSIIDVGPKKGDHIRFRLEGGDEWHVAEVMGAAGKKTGKNKHWYNVREGEKEYSLDFNQTKDLSIEEQCETVVVMVPRVDHNKPEVMAAKFKELKTWQVLNVYEEVPDVGQFRIQTNWVVTEKESSFKARLVVRGDQENHVLQGDSPTVSKIAIRIFLSIAASECYKISTKDVKCAFLQGKSINRSVYLEPPTEMKKPFVIWKLKKVAYGLVDAARNWYDSILQEMMALGCKKSIYENALFYYKDEGHLLGMLTAHVDDFLHAGNAVSEKKVINKITEKFEFGKECEIEFRYVGINIKQETDFITIDQEHYIKSMEQSPIDYDFSCLDRLLNEKEKKIFRGIVGSLNWTSIISRPDVSFEVVDLSTKFQAPTVGDLNNANKAVKKVKSTDVAIKYPKLKMNKNLKLVAYSDGSFRNLCKGVSSGSGRIVFLVDEDNKCCALSWNSNKLQKIVDSTLAAESLSLANTIKEVIYVKQIVQELIGEKSKLPIYCITDSKGARDAVYSTKMVDDKLTRLYVAAIKEHLENQSITKVIHVSGERMLADCLTKKGASSKLLLNVLRNGFFTRITVVVLDDNNPRSAYIQVWCCIKIYSYRRKRRKQWKWKTLYIGT